MNQETNLWLSIYRFACMHTITNHWIKHCTVPAREQGIAWVAIASNSVLIGRRLFNSTSSELPKSMYPTHTRSSEEYARTLVLYHWLSSVIHGDQFRRYHIYVLLFFYSTESNPFHCVRMSTMNIFTWITKKRKKKYEKKKCLKTLDWPEKSEQQTVPGAGLKFSLAGVFEQCSLKFTCNCWITPKYDMDYTMVQIRLHHEPTVSTAHVTLDHKTSHKGPLKKKLEVQKNVWSR